MNIAFDIDGVLTDVGAFQLKEGKRFFKDRNIVDEKAYGVRDIFGCTAKEEYAFWRKNILSYSLKFPARVGCGEMIAKIKEEGNNIFIISSRIKTASNDMIGWLMRKLVYRFLRKYGIPYDQIYFCSIQNSAEEKSQVCRNNKIDIMIEDCPENINALKQITQVICFDCKYNRKITDVYRVNNFYEIYEYVNKQNKNVEFKYKKRKERQCMSEEEKENYFVQLCDYYKCHTDRNSIVESEKIYRKCNFLLKPIFDRKYQYQFETDTDFSPENSAIYVANHRSMIDPVLIMSMLKNQPVHLLVKAEFLHQWSGHFLKAIGCVFVDRSNKDSQILAKEQLIKIVLYGGNIIIFPEGTRNRTDESLLEFKLGAVAIAQITGMPIVPIAIIRRRVDNSEKIRLKVGKKIYISYNDDLVVENARLRESIKQMLEKD